MMTDRDGGDMSGGVPSLERQQLAAILKSSTDAIISVDLHRVIRSWNPAAALLFGYLESEAIGKPADELIVPAQFRAEVASAHPKMRASRQPVLFESIRQRKNGSLVAVEINILPMLDEAGEVTNACVIYRDIGARIETLRSLQDSRERYDTLFKSIDDGFCIIEMIFDPSGKPVDYRFLEVNPSFQQQSGIRGGVGKRMLELVPEHEACWFEKYGKVAQTGEAVRFVNQAKALDGRWFDVYAWRIGQPGSFKVALLFSDITDRKRAEQALRDSEAKLRLGVGIAGVGLGLVDFVSDCITFDKTAAALLGFPANIPVPRRDVHVRFHPDDVSLIEAKMQEAYAPSGNGFMALDHRIVLPDGAVRWVSARKQTEFASGIDDIRRPSSGLIALRDITARIERIEALRESERLSRGILEASPDCIKVLGMAGKIDFINANGCAMLEIDDARQAIGTPWLSLWPQPAKPTVAKAMQSAFCGVETRFEAECPTQKGNLKWWDVIVRPIADAHGKVERVITVSRDITRRKQAETELSASEERLRLAANAARLTYVDMDFASNHFRYADNFAEVMGFRPSPEENTEIGQRNDWLLSHVVPEDRGRVKIAMQEFCSGKPAGKIEYRVLGSDKIERWIESRWKAGLGPAGQATRAFATNLDITERKLGEEHAKLIMAEVNHRAKNLLGVVHAVARQTARRGDADSFVERLTQRIGSLAASHDLLAQNEWKGVDMKELCVAQLSHFKDLLGSRILLEGPPARLTIAAAQGIGMALHELSTNAAKYGALSSAQGMVHVHWFVADRSGREFNVEWAEAGGPKVVAPEKTGFGHVVTGRMVETSVEGTTEIEFLESGLFWRLSAPLATALDKTAWRKPAMAEP